MLDEKQINVRKRDKRKSDKNVVDGIDKATNLSYAPVEC
jgi:hypothetical protein